MIFKHGLKRESVCRRHSSVNLPRPIRLALKNSHDLPCVRIVSPPPIGRIP